MNISHRIQLAMDDESTTVFVVPFCSAFLRVSCWLPEDTDIDDECVRQVDLYADRHCTRCVAEEIEWELLSNLDDIFLEIRRQQFVREDRLRGLQRLASDLRTDQAVARIMEGAA